MNAGFGSGLFGILLGASGWAGCLDGQRDIHRPGRADLYPGAAVIGDDNDI